MTSTELAAVAGIVLSLLFSYVPGLHDWYGKQTAQAKSGIMAVCILLVAILTFALSCTGLQLSTTCDQRGAWGLVQIVIAALVANQGTYVLSPQPKGPA